MTVPEYSVAQLPDLCYIDDRKLRGSEPMRK